MLELGAEAAKLIVGGKSLDAVGAWLHMRSTYAGPGEGDSDIEASGTG